MAIVVPFRGIVEEIGGHDTGKTIAMLQTVNNMKDVVFVDDDVKGEGTVRQMHEQGIEFELYIDLAKRRAALGKETPTADELLRDVVYPTIEEIVSKKRKVIIWDTWRIVYQSARGHVERNQSKYSSVVTFRGSSEIIQGLISKVARMIEVSQLNKLKASCDLLLISHHLKDNYVKNVIVGKIPESSSTFSEVCNMRMWLRHNPRSKVPVILFLKRPNLPKMTKQGPRFVNIVPWKITPTEKHESIWEAIQDYIDNPIESRTPRPDETPTPEEFAIISGTLSEDQKEYLKMMVDFQRSTEETFRTGESVEQTASAPPQERPQAAQKALPDGYPGDAIQLLQRAKTDHNMTLAQLQEATGKTFAELSTGYEAADWERVTSWASDQRTAARKKKAK